MSERTDGQTDSGTVAASAEPSVRPSVHPTGIPRTVKGLALVSLFNDFASEMVYPLLPAFVVGTLGGSAATLGALDGAADFTAAATKWFSGKLADRPGWRRPLILGGYASAILIRPLMAIASSAWQVVGFRVLDRIGKGMRAPAKDALIADVTPRELHGRAFGLDRTADHFGSIPGSLLAWWLLERAVSVRTVLEWSALPGLVAVVVLWFTLRGKAYRTDKADKADKADGADVKDATGRVFWAPVLVLTALTLFRLPETLLLLRLQDLGVAVAEIPLVWAGLHLVRTLFSYPGGWVSDRLGQRGTVALGGIVFALCVFILGRTIGVAAAITAFLMLGLVAGLTESAERAVIAKLAPKRTGRGFGVYYSLTGFVSLPAAFSFGLLYQRAGAGVALTASAAFMALAALLWLSVARAGPAVD